MIRSHPFSPLFPFKSEQCVCLLNPQHPRLFRQPGIHPLCPRIPFQHYGRWDPEPPHCILLYFTMFMQKLLRTTQWLPQGLSNPPNAEGYRPCCPWRPSTRTLQILRRPLKYNTNVILLASSSPSTAARHCKYRHLVATYQFTLAVFHWMPCRRDFACWTTLFQSHLQAARSTFFSYPPKSEGSRSALTRRNPGIPGFYGNHSNLTQALLAHTQGLRVRIRFLGVSYKRNNTSAEVKFLPAASVAFRVPRNGVGCEPSFRDPLPQPLLQPK